MNANCRHCQDALPWYPHALNIREAARVAEHLAECAMCQAEWARWQTIAAAVAAPRPGDAPPPDALARTLAAVLPRLASPLSVHTAMLAREEESAMSLDHAQPPIFAQPDAIPEATRDINASIAVPPPRRRIWPVISMAAIILASILVFTALRPVYRPAQTTSLPGISNNGMPPSWNDDFQSISFGTPDDGWAVGTFGGPPPGVDLVPSSIYDTPILAHYAEGQWRVVPVPATIATERITLTSVSMLSANEGWAVGHANYGATSDGLLFGVILHCTDGQWQVYQAQYGAVLLNVTMRTPSDGWIVGNPISLAHGGSSAPSATDGVVLHYDGHSWQRILDPAFYHIDFSAASTDATGAVWLAGVDNNSSVGLDGDSPAVIVHQTQAGWVQQIIPIAHARLNALAADGSGDIWAAGTILGGHTASGAADLHHPGAAAIFHLHNGTWTSQTFTDATHSFALGFNGMALTGKDAGWAVGDHGLIAQGSQGTWHLIASPTSNDLLAVAVAPAGVGWAVGSYGLVLRTTDATWSLATG
jgi:hypothetical protein